MKNLARITIAALLWGVAQVVTAIPLTLSGPIAGNTVGPQSTSAPCVIAGTQCQQPAGFGFNNFTSSGAITSFNMFSTTPTATVADSVQGTPYTVAQLTGAVGTSFNIAIDVNTTQAAGETLQLFEVIDRTTYTILYNYIGPTNIGSVNNNGNGFADWTLNTVSLVGLPSTELILFHAVWSNASDGAESFFLVAASGNPPPPPPPPIAVPEPETYAMMLAGLALMGFIVRRRKS